MTDPASFLSGFAAKTVLTACLALGGCQSLPGQGPSAAQVLAAAGKSGIEQQRPHAAVFEVVEVDAYSARLVSDYTSQIFSHKFGFGNSGNSAVVGIGDRMRVIIFEAGENGLFSTAESKQTTLDLVVQPDGHAPIPYVGSVRFAGRTAEQIRQTILASLQDKAVEPAVVVTSIETGSRVVTVSGAVNASSQVQLELDGDRISDVIAKAGGPANPQFETYVTLERGGTTATVLLSSIIANPSENIFVRPKDQIFVTHDPRTFTILGQTTSNNRIEFGSRDLNLLEAVALAGGGSDNTIDSAGYFVFRHEVEKIVRLLMGDARFNKLLAKGMTPDRYGRYPIVYRFNMKNPDSLIVGQNFPVKNRDVIFASRHPAVDLQRFLNLLSQPIGVARGTISLAE